MFIAYVVVGVLAAVANAFSATLDFVRYKQVSINMAKAGVPESWMTVLGILKAALPSSTIGGPVVIHAWYSLSLNLRASVLASRRFTNHDESQLSQHILSVLGKRRCGNHHSAGQLVGNFGEERPKETSPGGRTY